MKYQPYTSQQIYLPQPLYLGITNENHSHLFYGK